MVGSRVARMPTSRQSRDMGHPSWWRSQKQVLRWRSGWQPKTRYRLWEHRRCALYRGQQACFLG